VKEAYVLLDVGLGHVARVLAELSQMDDVALADAIAGCDDVVARVRARDEDSLARLTDRLERIDGVIRMRVCTMGNWAARDGSRVVTSTSGRSASGRTALLS
jgi:DNA-binding Lrp family transcriptional regulator